MEGIEPSKELRKKVLLGIQREERQRARVFLVGSSVTTLFSIGGITLSLYYVVQSFYQSGFYNYFSLFFSDPDVAFSYWQELSFSLLETIPLFEITMSLAAIALLMTSIRVFAINIRAPRFSFAK